MCGIVGGIRLRPGPDHLPNIRRMASTLQHRGPDNAGYATLDNGRLVLGHVRLSIVDIAAGPQPLSTPDGAVTISFNGEIYDHCRLRDELERKGHNFLTHTDTEVIPALYREYGLDFFKYLNGEFAFLLWDAAKKRLIAARDRYGVKPLFFHRASTQIYFCSENKGILALPEIERSISTNYLTGAMLCAFENAASAFTGIEAIRPGHFLMIENGHVFEQQAYWQPTFPTETTMSPKAAAEGVRHYLEQAVKRRLVADVPVCAYLSGGIDSALVCGLAAKQGQPIKAFNVGFTKSIYDETEQARHIAQHFGVPFDTIACPPAALAENLLDTIYHTETVLHNPSSVGKFLLSKQVNEAGYRVALTGEGADELLAGYPFFKLEALWRMIAAGGAEAKRAKVLLKRFEKIEARSEGALWNKGEDWLNAPQPFSFASAMYTRAYVYGRLIKHILHRDVLKTGQIPQHVYARHYDQNTLNGLHPLHASMVITLNQLSNYIFPSLGDRLEMAHHVEGRTPFLDRDLSDFISKIPAEHLIDLENLREKNVLHQAFDAFLPPAMKNEHKHPFLAPSWQGLSQTPRGKEIFGHFFSKRELEQRGLCNTIGVSRLQKLWKILPNRSVLHRKLDNTMGTLLTLQLMHEHFVNQRPKSDVAFAMKDTTPHCSAAA